MRLFNVVDCYSTITSAHLTITSVFSAQLSPNCPESYASRTSLIPNYQRSIPHSQSFQLLSYFARCLRSIFQHKSLHTVPRSEAMPVSLEYCIEVAMPACSVRRQRLKLGEILLTMAFELQQILFSES
jgi:hypothetical protein